MNNCLQRILWGVGICVLTLNQVWGLTIEEVSPSPHAVAVDPASVIRVTFDQPLDPASIQSTSMTVHSSFNGKLQGTLNLSADQMSLLWIPDKMPEANALITATLVSASSQSGSSIDSYSWTFIPGPYQGAAQFDTRTYATIDAPTSVASADFDQDGVNDLAVTGQRNGQPVVVLLSWREGEFIEIASVPIPLRTRPIKVGDMNNDGIPDLLLIHRGLSKYELNQFSTCFVKPGPVLEIGQTLQVEGAKAEPRSGSLADFDNDGDLDIAILKRMNPSGNNAIELFYNNGQGRYERQHVFWNDYRAESLDASDYSLDGYLDIIATRQGGGPVVAMFENGKSFPQFIDAPDITFSLDPPSDFEAGLTFDTNGNGLPDVLACELNSNAVYVYRHQGLLNGEPIYTTNPAVYTASPAPNWMLSGDVDSDGDMDVVVMGSSESEISVLLNDGSGHYSNRIPYKVPENAQLLTVSDLNDDGALDIAVVSEGNQLSVLWNQLNGNTPPGSPDLVFPVRNGFTLADPPVLSWRNAPDPDGDPLHFQVKVFDLRNPENEILIDSRQLPQRFTPLPPVGSADIQQVSVTVPELADGDYAWTVQAFDGNHYSDWSSFQTFTLDRVPPQDLNVALPDTALDGMWLNPGQPIPVLVRYKEPYPDSLVLEIPALNVVQVNENPLSDQSDEQLFLNGSPDGFHTLIVTLIDSAGNRASVEQDLGLDSTAPLGSVASVANDTSVSTRFEVSWSVGSDGEGSGVQQLYDIRYRENQGPWTLWLEQTPVQESVFTGVHNTLYEFEAAVYDRIGLRESFSGQPEAQVFVDTTANDNEAPPAPKRLLANGANPSPWNNTSSLFKITWDLPFDPSGVKDAFYKIGSVPDHNNDYSGIVDGAGPLQLIQNTDGHIPVYIWLRDNKGNLDYENAGMVMLRRDTQIPRFTSLGWYAPDPSFVDAAGLNWYRSQASPLTVLAQYYDVFADRIDYSVPGTDISGSVTGLFSQKGATASFDIDLPPDTQGEYQLQAALFDSAQNQSGKNLDFGMDGVPPSGTLASSPELSATVDFIVSWKGATDGTGSGLSGLYDVFVRKDEGSWQLWLNRFRGHQKVYSGENGHSFEFKAVAWDNVENRETVLSQAQTRTVVDITADDDDPPAAPINLSANGSVGASPWSNEVNFTINWINPEDESGVVRSYWKLGSPPASNEDFNGVGQAQGPLQIQAPREGEIPLYVWLEDKWQNVDFRQHAKVLLRYDVTQPTLSALYFLDPGYPPAWYQSEKSPVANLVAKVQDLAADSLIVSNETLGIFDSYHHLGDSLVIPISIKGFGSLQTNVNIAVVDSAGNQRNKSITLKIDNTPPAGANALSPDTTSELSFTVSWQGAKDHQGVGLSGRYDVRYREENGPWQTWLTQFQGDHAQFDRAKHSLQYEFEALAWDLVGNREIALGTAETRTLVDTTADDVAAPPPPGSILVDGRSDRFWKSTPDFAITWTLPSDESGLETLYYKVGSQPPTSNQDTTGSVSPSGPLTVTAPAQGIFSVYLWLADGKGNADYRNHARASIRYDAQAPVVQSTSFRNAGVEPDWYSLSTSSIAEYVLNYNEKQMDLLQISIPGLGVDIRNANPASLVNATEIINIPISGASDGVYTLTTTLTDSAGNETILQDTLHIDTTAPRQVNVISPDTTGYRSFDVSWAGGNDGDGVGLSGSFDVWVNDNSRGWEIWLNKTTQKTARYEGEHGHVYYFEAVAYDRLGNHQPRYEALSETIVDTTLIDLIAPPAPLSLVAGESNPSPWQRSRTFELNWQNPQDVSGISRAFYKFDSPPQSSTDTTAVLAGAAPASVRATRPYGQWLYLWLEDGNGNSDYRNYASVRLRYDNTRPVIDSLRYDPLPVQEHWFNPLVVRDVDLSCYYTEQNLAYIRVDIPGWMDSTFVAGLDTPFALSLDFMNKQDGLYPVGVTLSDSAGNTAIDSLYIGLDSTPPQGTVAISPDSTAPGLVQVTWSANAATDGQGSGLADLYDVRAKVNDENWQPWLTRTPATSSQFDATNIDRVAFEAAAYDKVGNREMMTGTEETVTILDPLFGDANAPGSPLNMTLIHPQPPGWSQGDSLLINWENPSDPSGITRARLKIGQAPTANDDTTLTLAATPPIRLDDLPEGELTLFLWLQDGSGNNDYLQADSLSIKVDRTEPVIMTTEIANAHHDSKWINTHLEQSARFDISYTEDHPAHIVLRSDILPAPFVSNEVADESEQTWSYDLSLRDWADGCYLFIIELWDLAGNVTHDTLDLCLDSQIAQGAQASSPETSANGEFIVSWSGTLQGDDGSGVGLTGEYDVRLRIDDGQWYLLYEKVRQTSFKYVGVHGHRYAFEVAAWDHVGNREPFLGQAESVTRVDTTVSDTTPPPAPVSLSVHDKSPSPWQSSPEFEVAWQEPVDPSGIARLYYKLNIPPQTNDDTTATQVAAGPLSVTADKKEGQMLYVWLQDSRGNVDFRQWESILLRYDPDPPEIDSLKWVNPLWSDNWFNQKESNELQLQVFYQESHLDSVIHGLTVGSSVERPVTPEEASSASVICKVPVASLDDGNYLLDVVLVDSAANRSAPIRTLFYLDSRPPEITNQTAITTVEQGTDIQVRALVDDENPLQYIRLLYRQGGSRQGTTVDMQELEDQVYTAFIPGMASAERGVEYLIFASDGVNQTRSPSVNSAQAHGVRVTLPQGLSYPQPLVFGQDHSAYRMISIPAKLQQSQPSDIFEDDLGAYDNKKWRLFEWRVTDNQFAEYPEIDSLRSGSAYWLVNSQENIMLDTGPATTLSTVRPFAIPLRKGWNDIAVPYAFSVDWQDIKVASALDTTDIQGPYAYEGEWLLPPQVRTLAPWTGYSLYALRDDLSLIIPAKEKTTAKRVPVRHSMPEAHVMLQMVVQHGNRYDETLYLGFSEHATEHWDAKLDFIKPRSVFEQIRTVIVKKDAPLGHIEWATDFRPPQDGAIWNLAIQCKEIKGPIKILVRKLTWQEDLVRLHDVQKDQYLDLSTDSTVSRIAGEHMEFRLLIGSPGFMEQQNANPYVPESFALRSNYPNPFNSSTVIEFELPGTARIELEVFNVLGQKVKTLADASFTAGKHHVLWDATDESGQQVATGVYLLVFKTPQQRFTHKMLYLR